MVCGGRGKHSRRTPDELRSFGMKTGLDGDALAQTSGLTARIDTMRRRWFSALSGLLCHHPTICFYFLLVRIGTQHLHGLFAWSGPGRQLSKLSIIRQISG